MEENFEIVYLFGFSARTTTQLENLLPILEKQIQKQNRIGIILIHDGVIGITTKGKIPKHVEDLLDLNLAIYAMIPDLKARGIALDYLPEKVKPIEYHDLIDILDEAPKIISWM
jgi:tRNA 2-thiouridine synthesizing protein B